VDVVPVARISSHLISLPAMFIFHPYYTQYTMWETIREKTRYKRQKGGGGGGRESSL